MMLIGTRTLMGASLLALSVLANGASASGSATGGFGGGARAVFASASPPSDHRSQLAGRRCRGRACSPITRFGAGQLAAVMPGDSFSQDVLVGGVLNFLSIYNLLITGRVLLSWVPQLQGVEALRPLYLLTDPYLNAFRRLNLNFGGLDFSVLPAFLLLSLTTNAVASLGAEIPEALRERMKSGGAKRARMPQPKRGNLEATDESSHRRRRFLAFR